VRLDAVKLWLILISCGKLYKVRSENLISGSSFAKIFRRSLCEKRRKCIISVVGIAQSVPCIDQITGQTDGVTLPVDTEACFHHGFSDDSWVSSSEFKGFLFPWR